MNNYQDDRVTCPNCQKKIIPRLTFENAEPRASWCPMCGKKVEDFFNSGDVALAVLALVGIVYFFFYF